jgi:predicted metalloprotease
MGAPALAIGGGGMLLLLVVGMLLGVDPQKLNQLIGQAQQGNPGAPGQERELTPEEIEQGEFTATVLRFVLFANAVQTGCGVAPSAVGPFYCPADQTVYLDPTFFQELDQRLGGSKAEFSQAYVMAHEIGHHVQKLLGFSDIVDNKRRTLPEEEFNEWSVRLELQADYLAGVWAHHGQQKFNFIEPGDIEAAITSANAIGDDRLQKQSTGFVSPEKYTHGTSEQRMRWFTLGLKTGDLSRIEDLFQLPYERL